MAEDLEVLQAGDGEIYSPPSPSLTARLPPSSPPSSNGRLRQSPSSSASCRLPPPQFSSKHAGSQKISTITATTSSSLAASSSPASSSDSISCPCGAAASLPMTAASMANTAIEPLPENYSNPAPKQSTQADDQPRPLPGIPAKTKQKSRKSSGFFGLLSPKSQKRSSGLGSLLSGKNRYSQWYERWNEMSTAQMEGRLKQDPAVPLGSLLALAASFLPSPWSHVQNAGADCIYYHSQKQGVAFGICSARLHFIHAFPDSALFPL